MRVSLWHHKFDKKASEFMDQVWSSSITSIVLHNGPNCAAETSHIQEVDLDAAVSVGSKVKLRACALTSLNIAAA